MKRKALVIVGASSHVMQGYQPLQSYETIFISSRKSADDADQVTGLDKVKYFKYDLEVDDPTEIELLNDLECFDCVDLIFASYVGNGLTVEDGVIEIQRGLIGNCIQPLVLISLLCSRFPDKKIGGVFISSIYAHVSPNSNNYVNGPQINPIFYGVAKAGVEQGLRWLSCQKRNHFFNSIALGPMPKRSIRDEHPEFIQRLVSSIPNNRLVERSTLHKSVDFLLDQDGDVRGETIFVDGGYTIW